MARSARSSAPSGPADEPVDGGADELSYRQAQGALELTLAELQTQDLDVEAMAGLYRRAQAYADRCESLLLQAEQEVMRWDPAQADASPTPYEP